MNKLPYANHPLCYLIIWGPFVWGHLLLQTSHLTGSPYTGFGAFRTNLPAFVMENVFLLYLYMFTRPLPLVSLREWHCFLIASPTIFWMELKYSILKLTFLAFCAQSGIPFRSKSFRCNLSRYYCCQFTAGISYTAVILHFIFHRQSKLYKWPSLSFCHFDKAE